MAISPHSTWTTEADKATSRPVYLANLEYDYLRAGVTYQADFKATGYAGDADLDTKPGKIILKSSDGDILSSSSYAVTNLRTMSTDTASALPIGVSGNNSYYTRRQADEPIYKVLGLRFRIFQKTKFNQITFTAKHNGSGTKFLVADLFKIKDKISATNTISSVDIESGDSIYGANLSITSSYASYTFAMELSDSSIGFDLEPGDYLITLSPVSENAGTDFTFYTWTPNDTVFNDENGLLGFADGGINMADCFVWMRGGVPVEYSTAQRLVRPGPGYVPTYSLNNFDGKIFIETFSVGKYANSTYTTPWMRVKNSSGTGTTPSTPGQLRLNYTKPLNTDITFAFYGDADGSDAGQVTIDSTAFDGDSVTSYYDYYKLVCTMTTTDWFSTPEISSLEVYFKLTNDYCKFDDAFTMADGSPARPYIDSIPSYETRVDPITNKVSFNEPAIDLIIQRKGLTKTQSDVESLIQNYWMTGRELALKLGWSQNVTSTNFIAYQTGITNNQIWDGDNIYRLECKDPYFQTKDPFLVDQADASQPFFDYDNPIDIMLTLISLSGIPQRLIDTASFSSVKSTYFSSWTFFRPYTEPIKDIKKELDEIALLTGAVVVTKEDGKVYCVKLDAGGTIIKKTNDTYTFTDQNSKEHGKAQIDLSKRVNVCSVQRGYWVEPSDKQSEDVEYWDTEIDEEGIINTGRSEVLKIENKWIPKSVTVGGVNLSSLAAQRLISRFRYGLWTLKRQTDLSFAFIQVGDPVSILGSQILFKNFYGENYVRGVVIGKEVRPSAGDYEGEIIFTIWIYENISAGLEAEPTAQPTSLIFSGVTTSNIDLAWTAASPAPDGYVVLFATGSYPNTLPEDGVQYTAGDTPNDATIAYRNTGVSFSHSSLSSDTEYFYKIFSYNDAGGVASTTNYLKVAPLVGSEWTLATEPGGHPTSLTFESFADSSNTNVSWTASASTPLAQYYLVLRRAGAAVSPDAPTDSNSYTTGDTIGSSTVVYVGATENFDDDSVAFNGTTYYYRVFAFRGSDSTSYNYYTGGTPLNGSVATSVAEPTAQPLDFDGESSTAGQVDLTWLAANPVVDNYLILYRKAGSLSDVPVDANGYVAGNAIGPSTVGYSGSSTSASVTGLTSGATYTFKIFAFNGSGATANYLTTGAPSITLVVS